MMTVSTIKNRLFLKAAAILLAAIPAISNATIVEFQLSSGETFEVNLYDNLTPQTVTNFLEYVNNGAYTNSIIHRSVAGFISQGGGFSYNMQLPLDTVTANAAINNEPEFSNVRGTIAMAKLSGNPNSATNQWFFNLADNSANLDVQNGGFTVFGEVVGNGMDVVDAIAALPVYDFGSPTDSLPLRDYTATDYTNMVDPDGDNFVQITAVIVSDTTVDSAAGLSPVINSLINAPPPGPTIGSGGGGGGGALGLLGALLLLMGGLRASRRTAS